MPLENVDVPLIEGDPHKQPYLHQVHTKSLGGIFERAGNLSAATEVWHTLQEIPPDTITSAYSDTETGNKELRKQRRQIRHEREEIRQLVEKMMPNGIKKRERQVISKAAKNIATIYSALPTAKLSLYSDEVLSSLPDTKSAKEGWNTISSSFEKQGRFALKEAQQDLYLNQVGENSLHFTFPLEEPPAEMEDGTLVVEREGFGHVSWEIVRADVLKPISEGKNPFTKMSDDEFVHSSLLVTMHGLTTTENSKLASSLRTMIAERRQTVSAAPLFLRKIEGEASSDTERLKNLKSIFATQGSYTQAAERAYGQLGKSGYEYAIRMNKSAQQAHDEVQTLERILARNSLDQKRLHDIRELSDIKHAHQSVTELKAIIAHKSLSKAIQTALSDYGNTTLRPSDLRKLSSQIVDSAIVGLREGNINDFLEKLAENDWARVILESLRETDASKIEQAAIMVSIALPHSIATNNSATFLAIVREKLTPVLLAHSDSTKMLADPELQAEVEELNRDFDPGLRRAFLETCGKINSSPNDFGLVLVGSDEFFKYTQALEQRVRNRVGTGVITKMVPFLQKVSALGAAAATIGGAEMLPNTAAFSTIIVFTSLMSALWSQSMTDIKLFAQKLSLPDHKSFEKEYKKQSARSWAAFSKILARTAIVASYVVAGNVAPSLVQQKWEEGKDAISEMVEAGADTIESFLKGEGTPSNEPSFIGNLEIENAGEPTYRLFPADFSGYMLTGDSYAVMDAEGEEIRRFEIRDNAVSTLIYPSPYSTSIGEKELVSEYTENGYLVLTNLNKKESGVPIPTGYIPVRLLLHPDDMSKGIGLFTTDNFEYTIDNSLLLTHPSYVVFEKAGDYATRKLESFEAVQELIDNGTTLWTYGYLPTRMTGVWSIDEFANEVELYAEENGTTVGPELDPLREVSETHVVINFAFLEADKLINPGIVGQITPGNNDDWEFAWSVFQTAVGNLELISLDLDQSKNMSDLGVIVAPKEWEQYWLNLRETLVNAEIPAAEIQIKDHNRYTLSHLDIVNPNQQNPVITHSGDAFTAFGYPWEHSSVGYIGHPTIEEMETNHGPNGKTSTIDITDVYLDYANPEFTDYAELIDYYSIAYEKGYISELGALNGLNQSLIDRGKEYGFDTFTGRTATVENVSKLLALGPDGKLIISDQICNQQAHGLYLLADSVGLPVRILNVYLDQGDTSYGGNPSNYHQVLAYFDSEKSQWFIFDGTEPDKDGDARDYPQLPAEELLGGKSPIENLSNKDTALIGIPLLLAAASIAFSRRKFKEGDDDDEPVENVETRKNKFLPIDVTSSLSNRQKRGLFYAFLACMGTRFDEEQGLSNVNDYLRSVMGTNEQSTDINTWAEKQLGVTASKLGTLKKSRPRLLRRVLNRVTGKLGQTEEQQNEMIKNTLRNMRTLGNALKDTAGDKKSDLYVIGEAIDRLQKSL